MSKAPNSWYYFGISLDAVLAHTYYILCLAPHAPYSFSGRASKSPTNRSIFSISKAVAKKKKKKSQKPRLPGKTPPNSPKILY